MRIPCILVCLILIFSACKDSGKTLSEEGKKKMKESLVDVNRILVIKDADKIAGFVKRTGWDMKETESGLWYEILEEGIGDSAKTGMKITMEYKLDLLDGTPCYNSEESGPKEFIIGKGGVEAGLEVAVLMFRKGSRARLILPPHLAYGLIGDEHKIPARAIIIYEVKVIGLEK